MKSITLVAALGGIASADPDLTIKHIPAKLQMRPKHVAQQSAPEATTPGPPVSFASCLSFPEPSRVPAPVPARRCVTVATVS